MTQRQSAPVFMLMAMGGPDAMTPLSPLRSYTPRHAAHDKSGAEMSHR